MNPVTARHAGVLAAIDNRRLGRIAKLAGAPRPKTAGVLLHGRIGDTVATGQPLYTVHAETRGELDYAMQYVEQNNVFTVLGEQV
jgi:thymidine phosphorylase